jgi:thymidylate synthase (FAD)
MNKIKNIFILSFLILNTQVFTQPIRKNDDATPPITSKILKPSAKLTALTPDAEKTIAYIARVSNPANQENANFKGLLKYCIKNHHWSVFEQAFMTLEVETSRAICTQILRHRSFTFQQFSQRYADNSVLTDEIPLFDLRIQDSKNRQNSIDNMSDEEKEKWYKEVDAHFAQSMDLYQRMLAAGIAKESARFVLPENMPARIYMSGSIRSWIHYIELRSANGTQKEHQQVAELCKQIFCEQLPTIAEALGWC